MRFGNAALVVLLAAAGVVASAVVPADAHDGCAALGDAGVSCARNTGAGNHVAYWVDSCDRASDGHKVRSWYEMDGFPTIIANWDPNGANPGCANDWAQYRLRRNRICVEVLGCSGWLEHP